MYRDIEMNSVTDQSLEYKQRRFTDLIKNREILRSLMQHIEEEIQSILKESQDSNEKYDLRPYPIKKLTDSHLGEQITDQ